MAEEIPKEKLKQEIHDVLKDADIAVVTSKKIRQQLEEKFNCNLLSRKEEIDNIIMAYMNKFKAEDESNSEEEEEDDDEDTPKKRPAPVGPKRAGAKRAKNMTSDESSGSEDLSDEEFNKHSPKKSPAKKVKKMKSHGSDSDESGSDEDYSPRRNVAKGKKSKQNDDSDEGSNEEWKKPKAAKKAAASGKGKGTGFTRPYTLSPVLAELMGAEALPRHEVVKKVWAIIKERNLYDPKNKQFAICDQDLHKVMGVKRFRTFGMLKYLKQHFIN